MIRKHKYYDIIDTGKAVAQSAIETLETELATVHKKLHGYLKELGLTHGGRGALRNAQRCDRAEFCGVGSSSTFLRTRGFTETRNREGSGAECFQTFAALANRVVYSQ